MSSSREEEEEVGRPSDSVFPLKEARSRRRVLGPVGWNGFFPVEEGLFSEKRSENCPYRDYPPEAYTNYTPEPGVGCKRLTRIESRGVYTSISPLPPNGVIYIFVQGTKSACIVTRDLGKDKDMKIRNVKMNLTGLADPRLGRAAVTGQKFEQPAEMYPYAFVCALLNADDLNEEKRSKPSSHKESSSRPLNEAAAINFLKQKLNNNSFKETIQTAISALQCLYQENVRADEIEVYAAHVDTAHVGNTHKCLSRGEIEMHLAAINLNLSGPGLENAGV